MKMKAFEVYPSEKKLFKDRISGANVYQLTSYLGHSHHAYFTNNGWWDQNRRLVFCSDRCNATNLCSIEIESGEISRLTDFPVNAKSKPGFSNDVNPTRPEIYYTLDNKLYALGLETLEHRILYTPPSGFKVHGGLVGSDGKYVYSTIQEDLSNRVYANLSASYIGMTETFEAKPDTRIIKINTETGKNEEIHQDYCWIGHVNPSPTKSNLITFCHEGPWYMVDHRIWILDVETGEITKIRPRKVEGEQIGHEYWFTNGEQIGYQVHQPNGGSLFGYVRYDNTGEVEAPCVPLPSPDHIHSNDFSLIVSDSGSSIKLYRYNGTGFDPARVLCMHDGGFFHGGHHPHPRFTEDGKQILYNSNVSGYCNIYLVDLPEDVTTLPYVE